MGEIARSSKIGKFLIGRKKLFIFNFVGLKPPLKNVVEMSCNLNFKIRALVVSKNSTFLPLFPLLFVRLKIKAQTSGSHHA